MPAKSFDEIPGPKGLPLIGTFLDYTKDLGGGVRGYQRMHEMQQQRVQQYGPIYREKIFDRQMVTISNPGPVMASICSGTREKGRDETHRFHFYFIKYLPPQSLACDVYRKQENEVKDLLPQSRCSRKINDKMQQRVVKSFLAVTSAPNQL